MVIVTRKYMIYDERLDDSTEETEYKFFADDDVEGVQRYVDFYSHNSEFDFKRI